MSILNFIPELWNESILEVFEKSQVFGKVCKAKIDAPITHKGQVVHITEIGEIDFFDYPKYRDMPLQQMDDATMSFVIDQDKAFNFEVDDIDAKQANGDLMGPGARKAAYKRKDIADKYIRDKLTAAAALSTTPATPMAATNIISSIGEMSLALEETSDVPEEFQWCIIPLWAHLKLLQAGVYHAQDLKGNVNGFITDVIGIDLYRSNNISYTNNGGVGESYTPIAGSYGAGAYAEQILETEAYRPQSRFSDALKGRHIYGAKGIKPNELVTGTWTRALETLI